MMLVTRSIRACLLIGLLFTSPLLAQDRKADRPQAATTYQDVLQLLKLGMDEDAILRKLETSPACSRWARRPSHSRWRWPAANWPTRARAVELCWSLTGWSRAAASRRRLRRDWRRIRS